MIHPLADPRNGCTPLHYTAIRNDVNEVQRLITEDPTLLEAVDDLHRTAFVSAAMNSALETMTVLKNFGVDINHIGDKIKTPTGKKDENDKPIFEDIPTYSSLMRACRDGNTKVVKWFIDNATIDDLKLVSPHGKDAMWYLRTKGHDDLVEMLAKAIGIVDDKTRVCHHCGK